MLAALNIALTIALSASPAAVPSIARGEWTPPNSSQLLERYRDAKVDALLALPAAKTPVAIADRDAAIARGALRVLAQRGLAKDADADATQLAIETIRSLRTRAELESAVAVLGGDGPTQDFIASDARVRNALFEALAHDEDFGERTLVNYAVTGDDLLSYRALIALPPHGSNAAERVLAAYLDGSLGNGRELFINRAAMIASAHASAALLPSLINAQFTPAKAKRGDEAWIAQGKSISYVSGVVPVVGDASGAFQPIVGRVFEGSVLRIMESAVMVYRTEVHTSLVAIVERETGQPAPPFGFDQPRWAKWYADDFPRLARAHAEELAHEAALKELKSQGSLDDA